MTVGPGARPQLAALRVDTVGMGPASHATRLRSSAAAAAAVLAASLLTLAAPGEGTAAESTPALTAAAPANAYTPACAPRPGGRPAEESADPEEEARTPAPEAPAPRSPAAGVGDPALEHSAPGHPDAAHAGEGR